MPRSRLVVAIALLLTLPLAWSWWSSDRRRIEGRLESLADAVAKSGSESALGAVASSRAVTEVFAEPFEIRAEQVGFTTRDRQELARFVHRYRATSERISMRVDTESLDVSSDVARASMVAVFAFSSGGPLGGSTERYRVEIGWVKRDGEWWIDYVELLEILQGPSTPLGF